MEDTPQKITVTLVPGLEPQIRALAEELYGDMAKADTTAELLSTMLPDLIAESLASHTDFDEATLDLSQAKDQEEELPEDIRQAISQAHAATERPAVEVPLEVATPPAAQPPPEPEPPTFEEFERSGKVNPDAISWAKGNPAKEDALRHTLVGLAPGLWTISRLPALVERTYNMRGPGAEEEQVKP